MDDAERYALTVTRDGRPTVRGWWGNRQTAERKFSAWVGQHDGAQVVLIDQADGGRVLRAWPDKP